MKNKIARLKTIKEIRLNPPKIADNKIFYSFSKNPLLDEKGFYIETDNFKIPDEIYEELLMPYLSICISFAVLKDITIILPFKISDTQINLWEEIINSTAKNVFKNKDGIKIINGENPINPRKTKGEETGLFFGGGTESLLTFARLLDRNIKPILISFDGPHWSGCDYNNPHKFALEDKLMKEFNISIIRVKTSFFELIYTPDDDWREYLDYDIWGIIRSALHIPFMLTVILSLAEELNISKIFIGEEKENGFFPEEYCFSTISLNMLKKLSNNILFERELENLNKIDVIRELHINYPHIAKYEYSCAENNFERWCLSCEKCFKIWLGLQIYNIDTKVIDMNQNKAIKNIHKMVDRARKSMALNKDTKFEYETFFDEALRLNNFKILKFKKLLQYNLWIYSLKIIVSKIKRKIKTILIKFFNIFYN